VARIRTVKPEFWTDEKIVELPFEARLFFIGSWNFADDNGNLERSSKKLKMQIFPADVIDCEPIIQSLITHGLLREYAVNGKSYLHVCGFSKHQVINRKSKHGLPQPNNSRSTHGGLSLGREGKGEDLGREEESLGEGEQASEDRGDAGEPILRLKVVDGGVP